MKQRSTPNLRIYQAVGLVLVVVSLVLALGYHSKHFYEVLVLGLFLILYTLTIAYISVSAYIRLYVQFVLAGLLGDLVLGLTITKLWYYNYASAWEYVALYLIVYPVAGLVMLQTYVFIWKRLAKQSVPSNYLKSSAYKRFALVLGLLCVLSLAVVVASRGNHLAFLLFFMAIAALTLWLLAYATHRRGHQNLVDIAHAYPCTLLLVLLLATYLNAFAHELPNVIAHQWMYTNWPLQSTTVLGIPVAVLVVWPALTLLPVSLYYADLSKSSKKSVAGAAR